MVRSKYLSVIIPVYNEEENVPRLHERIRQVLAKQNFTYEIIYVDDGSRDRTAACLAEIAKSDEHIMLIRFRRNFGQTAAMAAGVAHSTGEILVFLDGDLQNDPVDIPPLLAKMEEGYDIVSGWRKERQDAQISRKLPSSIANALISHITGVHLHDYGCTLKAYRYEVFQHFRLYGEMHRFLPAYAALAGASIAEVPVTHHARTSGVSKYGISRVFRVVLDLTTLKFLGSFGTRPAHAIGMIGLSSLALAGGASALALGRQITATRASRAQRQLTASRAQIPERQAVTPRASQDRYWSIALLFSGFGILNILLGLLAEMVMRTCYESQGKTTYVIREIITKTANSRKTKNTAA
ncbi:MAG TPA: glycosyltransferase family 2 protein [Ktedonobacteraceae bacterium]|nr:glycosyltransferase family 2 protein [Ktedonobacteraceae bacterium]